MLIYYLYTVTESLFYLCFMFFFSFFRRSGLVFDNLVFTTIPSVSQNMQHTPHNNSSTMSHNLIHIESPASTTTTNSSHSTYNPNDSTYKSTDSTYNTEVTPYYYGSTKEPNEVFPANTLLHSSTIHSSSGGIHTTSSMSGRSSPEYIDYEPATIYAPVIRSMHTDSANNVKQNTPFNRGYKLHYTTTVDDNGNNNHTTNTTTDTNNKTTTSSSNYNNQYIPNSAGSRVYATLSTPIVNADGVYTASHTPITTPTATPTTTPMRSTHNYYNHTTTTTSTKHRLEFDPEDENLSEHNTSLYNNNNTTTSITTETNSNDISFDCEMVFTSIYNTSPTNNTLNPNNHTEESNKTQVDADIFEGENEHFRCSTLDPKVNNQLSPDNSWAGNKRLVDIYGNDITSSNTSGNSGDGSSSNTTIATSGSSIYCNSSSSSSRSNSPLLPLPNITTVLPQQHSTYNPVSVAVRTVLEKIELNPEDAFQLGEVSWYYCYPIVYI